MWSNGHHVATWAGDGKGSVFESAPDAPGTNHPLATCGTGVGLHLNHTYYNCGTGTKTWTCLYRIIEEKKMRTLFEEAQYMLDNNINGSNRKAQARADGFTPEDVQDEIDLILSKYPMRNIVVIAEKMPTIKKGDASSSVWTLQTMLKNMGYYTGALDGLFGPATENALKAFQQNINKVYRTMEVDGICGPKVWSRLMLGR